MVEFPSLLNWMFGDKPPEPIVSVPCVQHQMEETEIKGLSICSECGYKELKTDKGTYKGLKVVSMRMRFGEANQTVGG